LKAAQLKKYSRNCHHNNPKNLVKSLKVGRNSLPAKTGFQSTNPPIKNGFEQKYIVQIIVAQVSNAWRVKQLLSNNTEMEDFFYKLIRNCCPIPAPTCDFIYNLATSLIQSASNPYFQNVLFQRHNERK
jgi:hypothetical protein